MNKKINPVGKMGLSAKEPTGFIRRYLNRQQYKIFIIIMQDLPNPTDTFEDVSCLV